MKQQSLSEKEESRQRQTDGSKTNNLEDSLDNSNRDTQVKQVCQDLTAAEMLAEFIAEVEDPKVYLFATKAQKVRSGYRFYAVDVMDVRRAK